MKRLFWSTVLLFSFIAGLIIPTSATSTTGVSSNSILSQGTITISLDYDYNMSQRMEGGQPSWFRSCTWGEFLFISGGTGSGLPPIAYVGGDPELPQSVTVSFLSAVPIDLYFLTQKQERWWAYYTSLWPYQFCAPPFYGWEQGWTNATEASFDAALPANTCPCTFLMFNMNSSQANVHFRFSGLRAFKAQSNNRAITDVTTTELGAAIVCCSAILVALFAVRRLRAKRNVRGPSDSEHTPITV